MGRRATRSPQGFQTLVHHGPVSSVRAGVRLTFCKRGVGGFAGHGVLVPDGTMPSRSIMMRKRYAPESFAHARCISGRAVSPIPEGGSRSPGSNRLEKDHCREAAVRKRREHQIMRGVFHRATLSRDGMHAWTLITHRAGFASSSPLGSLPAAGAYNLVLGNSQPVRTLVRTCRFSVVPLSPPLTGQPAFWRLPRGCQVENTGNSGDTTA